MARIAFSRKALATMNAGIQTQELAGVKAHWSWFLLFAMSILFIGVLIWGLFGALAETATGQGITLINGGGHYVIAQTDGVLYSLNISTGTKLSAGQMLGQISNYETSFRLRKIEEEYRQLIEEIAYLEKGILSITNLQNSADSERKKRLEDLKIAQVESKKRAKDIVEMYQHLRSIGAASKLSLYQALDQMLQTESTFNSTIFQSMETDVNIKSRVWDKEEKLLELKQKKEQKEAELRFEYNVYIGTGWLYSEYDGTVIEIFKPEGTFVQKGEKIALILGHEKNGIYLSAYVPMEQGKKIKTGMSAYFSPAAAPAEKYGYIKCVVREVSAVPVDIDTIKAELMNDRLSQLIVGNTVMMHVVVEMIPDENTASGYKWTSKKGYPHKITNGMMGKVVFNIGYKPPAMFVVPAIREFLNQTKAMQSKAE
ncbi:MAG: NHLP bacteriocin system secretion protein [Alphaproteobacteria bacterium]|nr:NHLP bacteriocin system secretion protein [Alphaproteobacteria bacterium]